MNLSRERAPSSTRLAVGALASLSVLVRCASVIDGSVRDGGAGGSGSQDAPPLDWAASDAPRDPSQQDGSAKRCRWRALPPVEMTSRLGSFAYLVDAVATGDGAWVSYIELINTPQLALSLRSSLLDAEGLRRGDPIVHELSLTDVEAMWTDWDPSRQTLAILSQERHGCAWSAVGVASRSEAHRIDPSATGEGITRVGCQALLRTREGYSFLSMRASASRETDLIRLDRAGRVTGARELLAPSAPAPRIARVALTDGDFAVIWIEDEERAPFHEHLRVQRLSPEGVPRGPPRTLAADQSRLSGFALVETGVGMLAIWEEFSGSGIWQPDRLFTRALDHTGAPTAATVTQPTRDYYISGGLSVTRRGEEVLVTTLRSRDGYRADVLVLDARGATRDRIDTGVVDVHGAHLATRIVATRDGALVLATPERSRSFGAPPFVAAVPLRCE